MEELNQRNAGKKEITWRKTIHFISLKRAKTGKTVGKC
jgi:hypothetical protein